LKNNDKLPPTQDPRCGTTAGHTAHRRRNEKACQPCLDANNVRAKIWRDNNKEKVAIAGRKTRLNNPERVKRNRNDWNARNPEKAKNSINNSRKKKPKKYAEYWRMSSRLRRVRKQNVKQEPYTEQQVLDAYGSICHICGIAIDLNAPRSARKGENWAMGLHLDHLTPIVQNGEDTLENIRPAHARCNLKKGGR